MQLLKLTTAKIALLLVLLAAISLTWLVEIDTHQHAENNCPIYLVSGVPCPGCGITRGIFLIMNGHVIEGIMMNPFSIVLIVLTFLLIGTLTYDLLKKEHRSIAYLNWLGNNGQKAFWVLVPLVLANWLWNIDKFLV